MWRSLNPYSLLVVLYITAIVKTVWKFLKKLNMELPNDPAIPLLGIYPQVIENEDSNRYLTINVHSSIIQ